METDNIQDSAPNKVGETIPANDDHAISVTLPTWDANVAYEEGKDWVVRKMRSGYPRFMIHEQIQQLAKQCLETYGDPSTEFCTLLPTSSIVLAAQTFIASKSSTNPPPKLHITHLAFPPINMASMEPHSPRSAKVDLFVLFYPESEAALAKEFWQHTGYGISSRMAEYCRSQWASITCIDTHSTSSIPALTDGPLPLQAQPQEPYRARKSPYKNRHYNKDASPLFSSLPPTPPQDIIIPNVSSAVTDMLTPDQQSYLEERYGRNLSIAFAERAKVALRRRIAGVLKDPADLETVAEENQHIQESARGVKDLNEKDVFLYPSGMSAIWSVHQLLLKVLPEAKSVCFGFTYVDTLKILEKWGPGCLFYGHASSNDLDDLTQLLSSGQKILGLFCEFPSNPLLVTPDLTRIRRLADKYGFAVVVDETLGNFINVRVLQDCDIVVSSLTKIFSGDCNVMGGSMVLNPRGRWYNQFKDVLRLTYEDVIFPSDAIFLERNSRDFIARIARVDENAELICTILLASRHGLTFISNMSLLVFDGRRAVVKRVYYPKYSPSRSNYDQYRHPHGGYGGLVSVTFHDISRAQTFFDYIETAKGPSLGTNFTLTCPYTILAHFGELDWAEKFGVERDLVRISVGLESPSVLKEMFERALAKIDENIVI